MQIKFHYVQCFVVARLLCTLLCFILCFFCFTIAVSKSSIIAQRIVLVVDLSNSKHPILLSSNRELTVKLAIYMIYLVFTKQIVDVSKENCITQTYVLNVYYSCPFYIKLTEY